MKIVDLTEEYFPTFACCFEEWSEEMTNAGDHKRKWYDHMKQKGLKVKLAIDNDGAVSGMIQYLPAEYSFIEGEDVYFIPCIWVYGYKDKGIGFRQKKGMGKALLQAAEKDVRQSGAAGIAAWGLSQPFWMPSAFFKKFGYEVADTVGIQELVWKRFKPEAEPPRWRKLKQKPEKIPGKVKVTAFISGWCTAYNVGFQNFLKAATEFGDKVEFTMISTLDKATINQWGITDAVFIDEEEINLGPPPSYAETVKMIKEKIDKL